MKLIERYLRSLKEWTVHRGSVPPLYIHIPKSAGTYLRQLESADSSPDPVLWPVKYLGHVCVLDDKGKGSGIFPLKAGIVETVSLEYVRRFFAFATVRNTFEWLVSYAGHAGGWSPKYIDTDHYDCENGRKGFDYLVRTIANRDDIWPCRKFIFLQLFSDSRGLVVDWITRTETLDKDSEELAKYLGIEYRRRARKG